MFVFIELQVDLENLFQPGFGEDLVPFCIDDFPFGNEVSAFRGTVDHLERRRRAVHAEELVAYRLCG